jgi:hypothetical protein
MGAIGKPRREIHIPVTTPAPPMREPEREPPPTREPEREPAPTGS